MKNVIISANKKIIAFIIIAVLVVSGPLSKGFVKRIGFATKQVFLDVKNKNANLIDDFKARVEDTVEKEIIYHNTLMDIDSLRQNLCGVRVIHKEHTVVVKTDSNNLACERQKINEAVYSEITKRIKKIQEISQANGANFLYVGVPNKEYFETLPSNVQNYEKINYDNFFKALDECQIPNINMSDLKQNEQAGNIYFATDHHWTPKAGMLATEKICEDLNKRFGFEFKQELLNIDNYNVKTYDNYFLGSYGKQTGRFFTFSKPDDFDYITPKFKTSFIESQPIKEEIREGSFEDTLLFKENIEKKALYTLNPYATYSGGDFRLQIMKNCNNPKGDKICLIRTSYACAVAPFLALQSSELHICDIRDMTGMIGEKVNIEKYVKKIKPNYVIVLYEGAEGIDNSDGRFNFFS